MDIQPIAHFESPLKSKFGIPRQSGLVEELRGRIVFEKPFRQPEAVRGLESFDYLWLIWEFSANGSGKWKEESGKRNLTVRPPRLGGNKRMGVFSTRSPFRPNPLGLSCVRIDRVEEDRQLGPVIYVRGADWEPLHVEIPDKLAVEIPAQHLEALKATLAQDPRPAFHDDPERTYGMPFLNMDVRFRVKDGVLTVVECAGAPKVVARLVDDDPVETQQ